MTRRKKILLLLSLSFIAVVYGLASYYMFIVVGPVKTFWDDQARVEVKGMTYHPGDNVNLRIIAEDPLEIAMVSVVLNSSIEGLQNVTLFSGGKATWGTNIVDDPTKDVEEYKECVFVLPSDLQVEDKSKLYFTVKITYVHAVRSGAGEFHNAYGTSFITIALDVEMPPQSQTK